MGSRRLSRLDLYEKASRVSRKTFALIALAGGMSGRGDDTGEIGFLPEPVTVETFADLKTRSPFLRSLGISDSVGLTGMARIENDVFVTLYDTETSKSHFVSRRANPLGWQLVDVQGKESDLETLTAKIQVAGGEVVSIRYEKLPPKPASGAPGSPSRGGAVPLSPPQLEEAKQAAVNYRKGYSADGFPKEPPPEIVQKLSRMNVQQRETINREMIELRNRGLGMEERRRIYIERVDQSLQGGR